MLNAVEPGTVVPIHRHSTKDESFVILRGKTEWQIDIIKENISHYCEATIDHSQLSYQEKEDQKRQMKLSQEVYIQGVKDEMRGAGRMK
jgi:hypothetical protein